jgi:hypothetical protein
LRRIPLSHRSHITGFQPLATGTAEHESALERDFVTRTSFLFPTASIISQPVTLTFRDGAKMRRYTPDFLVRRTDGKGRLIEVKYRAELRSRWNGYGAAFAAARAWARDNNASFRIATERHIRGTTLDNAKRLLPLRAAPVDVNTARFVVAAIREDTSPTFGRVLSALPNRRAGLTTLWRLIARREVLVDQRSAISLEALLSLP